VPGKNSLSPDRVTYSPGSGELDLLEDSAGPGYTRRQRFELEALRIQQRAKLIALAIRFGVVGFVFYCVGDAVKTLAGQTTIAEIFVKLLGNQGFSNTLAWLFGAGGIGYGYRERRLRHRDTKRLAERVRGYELSVDPGRRSSKLESQGDYEED